MRRQDGPIKQVLLRRRTAVNDIGITNMLLLQPRVLVKRGRQQPELGLRPALALLDRGRDDGELLEEARGVGGEAAVDDVDVLDGAAPHHEREADVPVRLEAAAEDGEDLDVGAAGEETGRGEGGAEGCEGAGVDEANGGAIGVEEVDDACRTYAPDLGVCR